MQYIFMGYAVYPDLLLYSNINGLTISASYKLFPISF